jgi:hypothetical protein
MDARRDRIGEHAAEHPTGWAMRVLGPVPEDPLDRLEWQHRAADIGAYRELYGYDHPDEPIGPEPAGDSTGKRAAWYAAFSALGPVDGVDLRGLPDGSLLHMRDTYSAETAWAPRHVGRELQRIGISADDASLAAICSQAEERIARQRGLDEQAGRHGVLFRSHAAMEAFYAYMSPSWARPWKLAGNGRPRPSRPAAWPWRPTPSFAVVTSPNRQNRHPGSRRPARTGEHSKCQRQARK